MGLVALSVAAIGSVVGCGQGSSQRMPQLDRLPLVNGSRISVRALRCDKGASAFCAWELVVAAPRYRSSEALLRSEHDLLRKRGWSGASADILGEHAADSPGHKLRVTYATAYDELQASDRQFIHRPRNVILALSNALFGHTPTLSMLLEQGAA